MSKIVVRGVFDRSVDPGVDCSKDEIIVDQSFKADCDINNIYARFVRTGELPVVDAKAVYGDFSGVTSYQDALMRVQRAEEAFNALDARVRAKFDNDPAKLVSALNDPSRVDELVELGVYEKPKAAEAAAVVSPAELMGQGEDVPVPAKKAKKEPLHNSST